MVLLCSSTFASDILQVVYSACVAVARATLIQIRIDNMWPVPYPRYRPCPASIRIKINVAQATVTGGAVLCGISEALESFFQPPPHSSTPMMTVAEMKQLLKKLFPSRHQAAAKHVLGLIWSSKPNDVAQKEVCLFSHGMVNTSEGNIRALFRFKDFVTEVCQDLLHFS